ARKDGGLVYCLWSLTWGLGWVPALAALAGAVLVSLRERRVALMLVPAAVLYLVFMGTEGRYFGRWLMPILPLLSLLAAFAAREALGALPWRARAPARARGAAAEPRGGPGGGGGATAASGGGRRGPRQGADRP